MINVEIGKLSDLPEMVKLDEKAYPGAALTLAEFTAKLARDDNKILVATNEVGVITGFAIVEFIDPDYNPENFSDLVSSEKLDRKWSFISAFTTETNFEDKQADSQLLKMAEQLAVAGGADKCLVPLTFNHPYAGPPHEVYKFFEANGYEKIGTINWNLGGSQLPCLIYRKNLDFHDDGED